MKIQLALDRLPKEECFRLVEETYEFIEVIEIGTGVIKEYGMDIVRQMKQRHPEKVLLADMKTCDAGKSEAEQALSAGADIVTVMGFAGDATIRGALEAAEQYGKEIMVDLLGIDDPARVKELADLGADLFCVHIGKDSQSQGRAAGAASLALMSGVPLARIAVAGGLDKESVKALAGSSVEIAIVGSTITGSENPREAARQIWEAIDTAT